LEESTGRAEFKLAAIDKIDSRCVINTGVQYFRVQKENEYWKIEVMTSVANVIDNIQEKLDSLVI
jgi:hypothetical protein